MASEPDPSYDLSSALQSLLLNTDSSSFIPPFIFPLPNPTTTNEGIDSNPNFPERFIFFNPFLPQLMVFPSSSSPKDGLPPASKASIQSLPSIHLSKPTECVICLDEIEVGGLATEMPCSHQFHPHCIRKWLELHGSCPLCRFQIPVDDDQQEGVDDRRGEPRIWVTFSFVQTLSPDSDRS